MDHVNERKGRLGIKLNDDLDVVTSLEERMNEQAQQYVSNLAAEKTLSVLKDQNDETNESQTVVTSHVDQMSHAIHSQDLPPCVTLQPP
jgi:hypothetical protein